MSTFSVKSKNEGTFEPFTLEVNVTSEQQATALFCLFNHSSVIKFLTEHGFPTAPQVMALIESKHPSVKARYSPMFGELEAEFNYLYRG